MNTSTVADILEALAKGVQTPVECLHADYCGKTEGVSCAEDCPEDGCGACFDCGYNPCWRCGSTKTPCLCD